MKRDGLFKKRGSWWIDYRDANGRRHRKRAAPSYEVAKLKTWLTQRADWIDRQFVAAPMMTSDGTTLTFQAGTFVKGELPGLTEKS